MKIVRTTGLFAIFSITVAGCRGGLPAAPDVIQTASAHVVESQQQQVPLAITATGTVHARETSIISSQVTGIVQQVLVHEGDRVHSGQSLVVLDDAVLRASVDQARAAANVALSSQAAAENEAQLTASTLQRYRHLQAESSVSPQEMDEVSRRAESATARLEAARAQTAAAKAQEDGALAMQSYTHIRASFSGIVTGRMVDPGSLATPGAPLLRMDRDGPSQLQVSVDESAIHAIHTGMKVQVAIPDAASEEITGNVSEIDPAADPASRSFAVKIDLPRLDSLHTGVYATTEFSAGTRQAIFVPRSAVVQRGSLVCAYILDDQDIAHLRYVTLGAADRTLVEVLSGISARERLVDNPSDRDLAGKRIEDRP